MLDGAPTACTTEVLPRELHGTRNNSAPSGSMAAKAKSRRRPKAMMSARSRLNPHASSVLALNLL